MNKGDREKLTALIAEWEWVQGALGSAEAATYGRCARRLAEIAGFTVEDLEFARTWQIYLNCCPNYDNEPLFEAISDFVGDHGYGSLVDLIEKVDFHGLQASLMGGPYVS